MYNCWSIINNNFFLLMDINDLISGEIILINKDEGWSSFDVVNKIRYAIKKNSQ